MKDRTRRFRLTAEQDEKLEQLAAAEGFEVSQYIRRELGLEGLSDRTVGVDESQPEGQRLAENRSSVPVSEPQADKLAHRVNQLVRSGTSQQRAERQARRELGL